jgi:hypothetical protein
MSSTGNRPVRRRILDDGEPPQRMPAQGDNVAAGTSFYNLLCQRDVGGK